MKRLDSIACAALVMALLLALSVSTTARAGETRAEKRVALVVGNASYKDTPLLNPVNDARAIAARLSQLDFDVVLRVNASRADIASAIAEYTAKITPATLALFYYAGHGIQVRGRNYLIPIDATIESEAAVAFAAIDVAQIGDEIEQAGGRVRLIVLDACRNNPFEKRLRGVGQSRGLAPMDAPRGSLIAFATAPGSVAADGDGTNSVYTGALLKALAVPGLKAEEVFKRARLSVLEQTRGAQTPWEQSALTGDLVLNAAPVAPTPAMAAPAMAAPVSPSAPGGATGAGSASDPELVFWQSAHAGNRREEYEAYLRQYPTGSFAALARARIAALPPVPPATARTSRAEPTLAATALFARARAPDARPVSPAVDAMMRRAEALAVVGDLAAARLFYERLAIGGESAAALALARSYDPAWLRQQGAIGVPPDMVRAAYWYARAEALAQIMRASTTEAAPANWRAADASMTDASMTDAGTTGASAAGASAAGASAADAAP